MAFQQKQPADKRQDAAARTIQKYFRSSRRGQESPQAAQDVHDKGGDEGASSREGDQEEERAARVIQRAFKGQEDHQDGHLTAQKRWDDALLRTKLESSAAAASSGEKDDANQRWKRGALFAQQISGPGEADEQDAEDTIRRTNTETWWERLRDAKLYAQNRDKETGKRLPFNGKKGGAKAVKIKKNLEEQHWLEMIDTKHRYGSNLKYYFEEWQSSETAKGNFFYWLDFGGGKDLSLQECARNKLEAERILYLSVEQRRRYLVTVDRKSGLLRWANPPIEAVKHTGEEHPRVETTDRLWTDIGNGQGLLPAEIVPEALRARRASHSSSDGSSGLSSDDDSSANSTSSSDEDEPHTVPAAGRSESISGSKEGGPSELAGPDERGTQPKKLKDDTWIYVSDSQYRLYLGIKQKGRFQHSSFLAGGPITSAGTLVVRDGKLLKCNPMSGHYRTKAVYFKRWIEQMESQGADLSEVKVRGTELKLWFIERANTLHALKGKTRRLKKTMEKKMHIGE